ncbi:MAG: alkaline phosphatase family protein [Defluviitaleaceae bacterium]|nr:alkaline phosphatase family protein [Defluviitaleaceae bacterium]
MSLLVISFDAVADYVFNEMASDENLYPNIAKFKKNSYYRDKVTTSFISNTYPIHTTISTGKPPKKHGIIGNKLNDGRGPWAQEGKLIKCKTIWQAAKEKKLKTAALLWPVTCGEKIDYHLPEVHVNRGENRLIKHLKYGSPIFQIKGMLKHIKLLQGFSENSMGKNNIAINLDRFTTNIASDLFKSSKKVDLALVHLISYDTIFHHVGSKGKALAHAKKSLDENLGKLLKAWRGKVLVFSDHAQLDVEETVNLHKLYGNIVHQQGGSAFFKREVEGIEKMPWFGRFLTEEELDYAGYKGFMGIAAKIGYSFVTLKFKGDHGYPVDYPNYNTFYTFYGSKLDKSKLIGHITDVTYIIAKELGLNMDIIKERESLVPVMGAI